MLFGNGLSAQTILPIGTDGFKNSGSWVSTAEAIASTAANISNLESQIATANPAALPVLKVRQRFFEVVNENLQGGQQVPDALVSAYNTVGAEINVDTPTAEVTGNQFQQIAMDVATSLAL